MNIQKKTKRAAGKEEKSLENYRGFFPATGGEKLSSIRERGIPGAGARTDL